MNIQGWLPLGWTGWISLHNSKALWQDYTKQNTTVSAGVFLCFQKSDKGICWRIPPVWTPYREQTLSVLQGCLAPGADHADVGHSEAHSLNLMLPKRRRESFIHMSLYKVVSGTNSTDVQSNPGRLRGYPKFTNKDVSTGWTWGRGWRKATGSTRETKPSISTPANHGRGLCVSIPDSGHFHDSIHQLLYVSHLFMSSQMAVLSLVIFVAPYRVMFSSAEDTLCLLACAQSLSHVQLCDPMDCSPPGSSAYGIFRQEILEWVAISYSRGSSWLRDWTLVSCISCTGRRILCHCATWKAQKTPYQGKCLVGQPAAHWDRSPLTLQYSQRTMILPQTTTIMYVHKKDQTEQIDKKCVVLPKITHNVSEYLLTRANNSLFIIFTTSDNQLIYSPICPQ